MEIPPKSPADLKADVQHLKDWMSKQPHLPQVEDEEWLITFLHHCKYSLEKTKTKLDNYFSYRNMYPDILRNRDLAEPRIALARKAFKFGFADRLTKDGARISFTRYDSDASIFDIFDHLKRGCMAIDAAYLENDRPQYVMTITDCQHLSVAHFLRALPGIKTGVDIYLSAYALRVKALHVINAPAHTDKVVAVFKSILPKKFADRFFVHSSPADLCKMVDEDVVCSDFGGKGPSFAEYEEHTQRLLERQRNWFLEQGNVSTNEELRRPTDDQVEGMEGSFRKLQVD